MSLKEKLRWRGRTTILALILVYFVWEWLLCRPEHLLGIPIGFERFKKVQRLEFQAICGGDKQVWVYMEAEPEVIEKAIKKREMFPNQNPPYLEFIWCEGAPSPWAEPLVHYKSTQISVNEYMAVSTDGKNMWYRLSDY